MQRGENDLLIAIAMSLVLGLVLFVLPGYLVFRLVGYWKRREHQRLRDGYQLPERAMAPRSKAWVLPCVVLLVVGILVFAPRHPGRAPKRATKPPILWQVPVAAMAGLLLYVAYVWFRNYDSLLIRSNKLLQAGETEEAAAILEEAMENQPTAMRANQLACALISRKDWQGAYKWLLRAQELGLADWVYRNNLCAVLMELGRSAEAIELIESQALRPKASVGEVCMYCRCLIEVGRLGDAWDQIRRAEDMFATGKAGIVAQRDVVRVLIDGCRSRYEEYVGKKSSGPIWDTGDEL